MYLAGFPVRSPPDGSEAALLCLPFVARDGLLRPYETGIRPLEVAVALRALHLPPFAHVLPPVALQSAIVRRRPARWEEARSRKTCSRSGCSMLFMIPIGVLIFAEFVNITTMPKDLKV